jgi:hypothetical protein
MPPAGATVFIDTNAIGAAHRYHCWNALRNRYQLCTVGICLEEATRPNAKGATLTGKTLAQLSTELSCLPVSPAQEVRLMMSLRGKPALDPGEKALLAAAWALGPTAPWVFCGPDRASLVALHFLKMLERMVSLETLGREVGHRFAALEEQYTEAWLKTKRTKLLLGEETI